MSVWYLMYSLHLSQMEDGEEEGEEEGEEGTEGPGVQKCVEVKVSVTEVKVCGGECDGSSGARGQTLSQRCLLDASRSQASTQPSLIPRLSSSFSLLVVVISWLDVSLGTRLWMVSF